MHDGYSAALMGKLFQDSQPMMALADCHSQNCHPLLCRVVCLARCIFDPLHCENPKP